MNRVRSTTGRTSAHASSMRRAAPRTPEETACEMANVTNQRARVMQELDSIEKRREILRGKLGRLTGHLVALEARLRKLDPAYEDASRSRVAKMIETVTAGDGTNPKKVK